MRRRLYTAIASAAVVVGSIVPGIPASAAAGDCSSLGKYEWAQFQIGGPLYPGYYTDVTFNDSAYQAPFTVHAFGTTTTQYPFYQPPIIHVPANVSPGSHYGWVEQCGRKVAEFYAYVNALQPWAIASKWYVPVNETISWEAYNFRPSELVQLFADGVSTGVSVNAFDSYAPHHGIDYQGQIKYGVLKYTIPPSMKGKKVRFELRGQHSNKSAQTVVSVA